MNENPILKVDNLKKYFNTGDGNVLKAVDGVTFSLKKGETFGLVGESGCGKSTLGRTIIGLYEASGGSVHYAGEDVFKISSSKKRELKKKMQIIFQDPYASLNPRMTVGDIIAEGIDIFGLFKGKERENKITELLSMVGLNKEHANRFPHEFSGGQRQRIGIARTLAINPEFIVCDEPISALDVSIQAQIVNLLIELQKKMGLTYLFIAHDLSMVKHISDRIGVMYLGKLIEVANSEDIYSKPMHPYTKGLIAAIPVADPNYEDSKGDVTLQGEIPSPLAPPSGCRFRTRCQYAKEKCINVEPELRELKDGRLCACHFAEELSQ